MCFNKPNSPSHLTRTVRRNTEEVMTDRSTCVPVRVGRVCLVVARVTVADPLFVKWETRGTCMELLVLERDGVRLPTIPYLQESRLMCHGF